MKGIHDSSHWLTCHHQIGYNRTTYRMACNLLKRVPSGRVKIQVFGNRYWGGSKSYVRYVDAFRVKLRD